MSWEKKLSRRDFLSKSAKAATTAAVGPLVITNGALGGPGRPPASERIITGHIGVGGRGRDHLRSDAAAVCDVYRPNAEAAAKRIGHDVAIYTDYRYILDRKDIDAVVIATPDHWHALMAIHACEAGKDVYVEKPLARTIREGRAVVEAARRYSRIVQVGSQGRSTPGMYRACLYIRNGNLGRISKVTCWHPENPTNKWRPDEDPPPDLDYDLWLGPARWVPFNRNRFLFNFRWYMEFGGGNIRDRGAHIFSDVIWAMNLDHTGPVSVEASGAAPESGMYDCPTTMDVRYEFKEPYPWTLIWQQPGTRYGNHDYGFKFWGEKDSLVVRGGDGGTYPEDRIMSYESPPGGVRVYRSPGHMQDFLNCVKSRKQPIMPPEAGHRAATISILGNIAWLLGRKLYWDPVKEEFINDEEANRLLHIPYRAPWHL